MAYCAWASCSGAIFWTTMAKWIIVLIICTIIGTLFAVQMLAPSTPKEVQQQYDANAVQRDRQFTDFQGRALDILLAGLQALLAALIIVPTAIAAVMMYNKWSHQRTENLRPRDGAYAAITRKQKVNGKKVETILLPHTMVAASATLQDGKWEEHAAGAGWDRQLTTSLAYTNNVAAVQAATPGDRAIAEQARRFGDLQPGAKLTIHNRAGNTTNRNTNGTYMPRLQEPTEPEEVELAEMPFAEAWNKTTPEEWIVGYDKLHELAVFEPHRHTSVAIAGGTGVGKTFGSGFLILAYAIRFGYKCVILDGKNGLDLRPFAPWTEYAETNADQFPEQLTALLEIHHQRTQMLKQAGAATVLDLPPSQRPQEIMVLCEEFGDVWDSMRGRAKTDTEITLNSLLRKSRATGFHWCFIDQFPSKWPGHIATNVGYKMVYALPSAQSNVLQEYNCNQLDRGEFKRNNRSYKTWDMKSEINGLLRQMPTRPGIRLLPPPNATAFIDELKRMGTRHQPTQAQLPPPAPRLLLPPEEPPTIDQHETTDQKASRHDAIVLQWLNADMQRWQLDRPVHLINGDGTAEIARRIAAQESYATGTQRDMKDFKGIANERLIELRQQQRQHQTVFVQSNRIEAAD